MKKRYTATIIIILQIFVCSIMLFGHAQQSFGQYLPRPGTSPFQVDNPAYNPFEDYPNIDPNQYEEDIDPVEEYNRLRREEYNIAHQTPNQNNKLTGEVLTASVSPVTTLDKPIVFTPQVGLPGFMSRYAFTSHSTSPIAKLMAELFKYGVQIIVILALIVTIVGGFLWSTAGGNGQKVTEAKQWIFSGLGGLSLALFAYLILRTINIGLVSFKPTSIETVTGLTLNTKSNPDQVMDDRGFLYGIYSDTVGDPKNLDSEACCIVYNVNTKANVLVGSVNFSDGDPDTINVASIAYSKVEDNFEEVKKKCLEFARKITYTDSGETNGKAYDPTQNMAENDSGREQFFILSKDEVPTWGDKNFNDWTLDDFKDQVKDLALFIVDDSACWGIDSEPVQKASQGFNTPTHCASKSNGWPCIITENQTRWWGYCEGEICKRCLGYGQTCHSSYQCPDTRKIIGNSTIINGWQCGDDSISQSLKNECHLYQTHLPSLEPFDLRCACKDTKCYNECAQNTAGLSEKKVKQFCTK